MLLCYVIDSGLSTSLLLLATLIIMFYIYITFTMQVQLRVIREGIKGNTVSAHNVHEVGHIYYK